MLFNKHPQINISVCIPVYNTEQYLAQCLQSVLDQDFTGILEVIVVSDASPGRDPNGRTAEKIVKEFKRKSRHAELGSACTNKIRNISFRYLENAQNLSLIETRRRLVNEAQGKYIFMLDSDDFLPANALSTLYDTAIQNDADVVQGDTVTLDIEGKNHIESKNEAHAFEGILEGKEVFDACFCDNKYRGLITAKLIRTSIYQKAFEEIPYIKSLMAEDVLQYFFVAFFSKKYIGINVPVYYYRIGAGITVKQITSLEEWEKVCSTASIITAIYGWVEEQTSLTGKSPLNENEMNALQKVAKSYCINNVKQLRTNVIHELYNDAYNLLKSYWGEQAIKNTEEFLNKQ